MPKADEPGRAPPRRREPDDSDIVLAELVSRVLDRGVVVAGDVTISVAGIDLVYLGLSLRLVSTETLLGRKRVEALPPAKSREPKPGAESGKDR